MLAGLEEGAVNWIVGAFIVGMLTGFVPTILLSERQWRKFGQELQVLRNEIAELQPKRTVGDILQQQWKVGGKIPAPPKPPEPRTFTKA